VQYDGTAWSVVTRCLPLFPPLTGLTQGKGIHVTDVRIGSGEVFTPLLNDSNQPIPTSKTALEIRVLCDAPIDPVSAQPTTCFLTLELPYPLDVYYLLPNGVPVSEQGDLIGYQPLIVPAQVSATEGGGTVISLRFKNGAFGIVHNLLAAGFFSRVVARLTLKGNFLWGKDDPNTYLDGAAFGVARQDPDGTHIGLNLPKSGNGVPGSDFQMWFWFFRPVLVKSVTMNPNPVTVGQDTDGTVTLDGFVPPGTPVALAASPNLGTIDPTSVPITAGGIEGFFKVTNTTVPAGAASAVLKVTATYAGSSAEGDLTINQVIRLINLNFDPQIVRVADGGKSTGTVTLNVAAPPGGAVVTLTSSKPNNFQVPATVTIPATKTSFAFPAKGDAPVNTSVDVVVTAKYAGITVQAKVEVQGVRQA
jgi:hypothetical protein